MSDDFAYYVEKGRFAAFQFDGGFPLAFLADDERVRRAIDDDHVCEVFRAAESGPAVILAQLKMDDWIVRNSGGALEGGGDLEVFSDDDFRARFEKAQIGDSGGD